MPTRIRIHVLPKPSVLDPQGVAVRQALHQKGATEALSARIGKVIEMDWEGAIDAEHPKLNELCRDLLSNPVIEDYRIEIVGLFPKGNGE